MKYARHSNSMTNSSQERCILHDSTSSFVPSTSLTRIFKIFLVYGIDKAAYKFNNPSLLLQECSMANLISFTDMA